MAIRLFKLRCSGIMRDSGQQVTQAMLGGRDEVKLVTASADTSNNELLLRGNLLFLNPDHSIELWLPREARCAGVRLVVINISTTSSIYVKDNTGEESIATLSDNCAMEFVCSGESWYRLTCASESDGYG